MGAAESYGTAPVFKGLEKYPDKRNKKPADTQTWMDLKNDMPV
jgi:hypothetical protein